MSTTHSQPEKTPRHDDRGRQTGENLRSCRFKLISSNLTLGEIEVRNDSFKHYRQLKFWVDRK
ncbi:hypothetical protein A2W24_02555 [Microgenomates group bacterium RBG_16_45_19]|nr:MAG: hypothetical protein A2W24_02555 [Microgenomates group bacterium RBG_16_45_19]